MMLDMRSKGDVRHEKQGVVGYKNGEFTYVCREGKSGTRIWQGGTALYDGLWSVHLLFLPFHQNNTTNLGEVPNTT